jgi:hypothetical protein
MNRSKRFVRLRQRPFLLEHLQLIERFILFLLLADVLPYLGSSRPTVDKEVGGPPSIN